MINIDDHTIPDLTDPQDIVIIGYPGTGKTTYAANLHKQYPNHILIHTDNLQGLGYRKALYGLILKIKALKVKLKRPVIVEGVLGYRLLRHIKKGEPKKILDSPTVINLTNPPYIDKDPKFREHLRTILKEIQD